MVNKNFRPATLDELDARMAVRYNVGDFVVVTSPTDYFVGVVVHRIVTKYRDGSDCVDLKIREVGTHTVACKIPLSWAPRYLTRASAEVHDAFSETVSWWAD